MLKKSFTIKVKHSTQETFFHNKLEEIERSQMHISHLDLDDRGMNKTKGIQLDAFNINPPTLNERDRGNKKEHVVDIPKSLYERFPYQMGSCTPTTSSSMP